MFVCLFVFVSDEQKKLKNLTGCGIESMWPMFKPEILSYQSKANLDVIVLLLESKVK